MGVFLHLVMAISLDIDILLGGIKPIYSDGVPRRRTSRFPKPGVSTSHGNKVLWESLTLVDAER